MGNNKPRVNSERIRSRTPWNAKHQHVSEHIVTRVFDNQLSVDAEVAFGYMKCPCCRTPMYRGRKGKKLHHLRETPTMAHDVAVAYGGNPAVWLYACAACNSEQGARSFEQWAQALHERKDRRADHVDKVATFVADWCQRHGVSRLLRRA